MARLIKLNLKNLNLSSSKSRNFYEDEALNILKKFNKSDPNFKYFVREIVMKSKEHVDTEILRDIVSNLQKHICMRINNEESSESCLIPLRNKIKKTKKGFYD